MRFYWQIIGLVYQEVSLFRHTCVSLSPHTSTHQRTNIHTCIGRNEIKWHRSVVPDVMFLLQHVSSYNTPLFAQVQIIAPKCFGKNKTRLCSKLVNSGIDAKKRQDSVTYWCNSTHRTVDEGLKRLFWKRVRLKIGLFCKRDPTTCRW